MHQELETKGHAEKVNILIVTQYFWPENFRINDLASGLLERGHKVEVVTGIPNYPGGEIFREYGYFIKRKEYYKGHVFSSEYKMFLSTIWIHHKKAYRYCQKSIKLKT